jgi:tripartite-type tricarboxylate transporter receptor subunit TctC
MKKISTAKLLSLALLVLAMTGAPAVAYPDRVIRIVVAYPPGGVVDTIARLVANRLGQELGGNVVIENVSGASGILGTAQVARAAPDGYTLSMINSSTVVLAPLLFKNVPYDPENSFSPISQVSAAAHILVVPPTSPAMNLSELVAFAKSRPNELNYASFGRGSIAHLAAELFQIATGTKMTHVPYRGAGPIITDMLGGSVKLDVYFDSISSSLPFVKDGRLRALAVSGKSRTSLAPEIPTIAESYPDFEVSSWQGLAAPAGTPRAIVSQLHSALKRVMSDPELQRKMRDLGAEAMSTSPEETASYIKNERARWQGVIDKIGIRPE